VRVLYLTMTKKCGEERWYLNIKVIETEHVEEEVEELCDGGKFPHVAYSVQQRGFSKFAHRGRGTGALGHPGDRRNRPAGESLTRYKVTLERSNGNLG